jgi:hypothetical protein
VTGMPRCLATASLRAEGELTEMAGGPLIREIPVFQRFEPPHANARPKTSDYSARGSMLVRYSNYFLE